MTESQSDSILSDSRTSRLYLLYLLIHLTRPLHALDQNIGFPPVTEAMEDGLLAMGGDVCVERLILAYHNGIFPWYDGDLPLWWSPDPRFVLFPEKLKVSKSMEAVIRKKQFRFTTNTAFSEVIKNCKELQRKGQDGTWITDELENSLLELHKLGYAHCAEAWHNNELVGGLYGVRMGNLFLEKVCSAKKVMRVSLLLSNMWIS